MYIHTHNDSHHNKSSSVRLAKSCQVWQRSVVSGDIYIYIYIYIHIYIHMQLVKRIYIYIYI